MRQHQASALLLRLAGIIFGIGSLAIVGCGDGRIPTYEVNGQVNVNGRPAEGAIVIFCPVNQSAEVEHLRPAGMANASGQFTLTTFEPNDGAPAGEYSAARGPPRQREQGTGPTARQVLQFRNDSLESDGSRTIESVRTIRFEIDITELVSLVQ
jgi:hypothetical protein